ncbi:MAG: type I DNA topoisomerase [Caldilineaceae bacterium SB0665_bin_21]|nr:type I DNA topoisomerase [Caldilineaceae bacterium SB0665_bin_21]MYA05459.1 type I DNA topoisomerase [Caldilineaceae bacterium SB0664_bin_22]MYC61385.1 type I DNA topoisomerase [Caldilineaceae bacterium SB0661_bin_34]
MTKLIIVESPTKARTIQRFLPSGYTVLDSRGHIRGMPRSASEIPAKYKKEPWSNLAINVNQDFEPIYIVFPESRDTVRELKQALRTADELLIATDEDREGESIGWHLCDELKPAVPVRRVVFHEITRTAVQEALAHPRELDANLVDAQKARQILDRLIGYTVSPLLWKKIAGRLSAGRVQSVAVRILVDRERERAKFMQGSYWTLVATLARAVGSGADDEFRVQLRKLNGLRLAASGDFDDNTGQIKEGLDRLVLGEDQARQAVRQLAEMDWRVQRVAAQVGSRKPSPPFTTSTLQIEANRRLGMSAEHTMRTAQSLYENGHITYMRTDSVSLAPEAVRAARMRVAAQFGADQLTAKPRVFRARQQNAQEAHEAIRPAGERMVPAAEKGLSGRERDLYDLIWRRTVATQMIDAQIRNVTLDVEVAPRQAPDRPESATDALAVQSAGFRATGVTVLIPGFLLANPDMAAAKSLPELAEGDLLAVRHLEPQGRETRPPARYTDASLIKTLTDNGIGRPSTYATIIETVQSRGYCIKRGQQMVPTFMAFAVVKLLEDSLSDLVNFKFTADMETNLDNIAAGDAAWLTYMEDYYLGDQGLEVQIAEYEANIDPGIYRTVELPRCRYPVVIGRYGPFIEKPAGGDDVSSDASVGRSEQRVIVSVPEDLAPADVTTELADELFRRKEAGPAVLGRDATDSADIQLLHGRFGPYLQLGLPDGADGRLKRVSLPDGLAPEQVTLEQARELLALPSVLGSHSENGMEVTKHMGRYGPYVSWNGKSASLKGSDTIFNISLARAEALLAAARPGRATQARVLADLGPVPDSDDDEPVQILDGRYGPYIKYQKVNASLPKDTPVESVDMQLALDLIEKRRNAPKRRRSKGTSRSKSGTRSGKGSARTAKRAG